MTKYDIAFLGGGTVASMAFFDACSRGYKCILIEKGKIGMQTNYASLGLSQIGANYLYKDRRIVYMNAIDCGVFKEVARDFVRIQPFIFPVFEDSHYPLWLWDGYLSAMDHVARFAYTSRHTILPKDKLLKREPNLSKDVLGGAIYHERYFDPVEFAQALIKAAQAMGGVVLEDTEVKFSCFANKKFYSVGIENEYGEIDWIYASIFVNACGPWAPRVLKKVFGLPSFETRMTRGTSIIIQKKLCNANIIAFDENHKYISILPIDDNTTLIGPTNVDIDPEVADNPDLLAYEAWEIEKLIRIANQYLDAKIDYEDIQEIKVGLRPQFKHPRVRPNNISHDFGIIDHNKRDGYSGLLTIFGGKLSNQIRMAKELNDEIDRALGRSHVWRVPYLKINRDGTVTEREEVDALSIRKLYKKKLALTYKDDVRKIAWIRRIESVLFLTPFLLMGIIRHIYKRRGINV